MDCGFGEHGLLTMDFFGYGSSCYVMDIYGSGAGAYEDRILLAGYTNVNSSYDNNWVVVRLLPTGELDTSFSGDGKLFRDISGTTSESVYGVHALDDGRVWVAGQGSSSSVTVIAMYTAAGNLDTSFSGDGLLDISDLEITWHTALDSSGRLLLAGKKKFYLAMQAGESESGRNDFRRLRRRPDKWI